MKKILMICLALAATTAFYSCDKDKTPGTPTGGGGGGKTPIPVDPTTYDQYMTCKIDGTTYTAYYTAGHTTSLNCVYNTPYQTVFETGADEIELAGSDNLLSNMSITLFGFQAKGAGTYTGGDDLYLDGTIERAVNGSKQRISYVVKHGQTLIVTSYNNGYIEGTFAVEVYDENSTSNTYQITDGKFRMKVQ